MKLGMEVGLVPGDIVLDWDPAPPPAQKRDSFWPMSVVAKRSPISATTEHLFGFRWEYNFGCIIASDALFDSKSVFLGSGYLTKTWPRLSV